MKVSVNRDILFASGAGLVICGLFPYLHARFFMWGGVLVAGDSDSSTSEFEPDPRDYERVMHPLTNTAFDPVASWLGIAFGLLGVGVLILSYVVLPRRSARVGTKIVGVPLFLLAVTAAALVQSFYYGTDVAAAWQDKALRSFDREADGPLEIKFNPRFCRAFGDRVCQVGSVEDGKALFTQIQERSSTVASQVSISKFCDQSAVGEEEQICQRCRNITPSPPSQRPSALLSVIRSPSQDAVHWCGEYLWSQNPDANLESSPFRQHREEVLRNWDESPVALALSVRLLVVLIWFSLTSIVGMAQLYFAPKRLQCPGRPIYYTAETEECDWDFVAFV